MIRRPNTNKVNKATTPRRPTNRRIDEDQLAAHFEGNEEEHALYRAAAAAAEETVMDGVGVSFKGEPVQDDGDIDVHDVDVDVDAEAEHEPESEQQQQQQQQQHHGHVHVHEHGQDGQAEHALDHGMPMAPMSAEPLHDHDQHNHNNHHHQQPHAHTHHSQHQQAIDDILGTGSMSYAQAAAAATAADLQPPPPPQPNVGPTISAPQPLVAATDFQPTPSTQHTTQQVPPPQQQQQQQRQRQQQQQQQQQSPPAPLPSQQETQQQQPKTTEQMAQESGYAGFKVDSAFAKRMARDPGQRLAEQRRQGQDLNLVRRSNVEALFAQIAGAEAQHPCAHCRKGQGPWTVCVVYSGQMMGSCANCWFNASGSRCSFHEKSQPVQPAQHPYAAVPVPVPVTGDQQPGGAAGAFVGGSPTQLQAAQFWQMPAVTFSSDAGVKQTVLNALTSVRSADRYQRALIEVDVAAKQLALKIVHAEELAARLTSGGGGDGGIGIGGDGHEDDDHVRQDSHYESPAPGGDMHDDGEP